MSLPGISDNQRPAGAVRLVFFIALLIHGLFICSWLTGCLDFLFVEAIKSHGQAGDFYGIYQAGANLLDGYSIYDSYDYLTEAPLSVPYYYFYRYLPPTAYIAAIGALLLPPQPAYWIWLIINELMIAALALYLLRARHWPVNRRWLIAALWLGFFPIYIEQWMGQFSISMALLLWLIWRFTDHRPTPGKESAAPPEAFDTARPVAHLWRETKTAIRDWRFYRWRADQVDLPICLLWAATITLKSFSVFLTWPFLLAGKLKRILSTAAISILLCLPYFLWRPADIAEFYRLNLGHLSPQIYMGAFGLQNALRDFFVHLPGGFSNIQLTLGPETVYLTSVILTIISLLSVGLAMWASLRFRFLPHQFTLNLTLWLLVFFLVFKSIWEYHYLMILPGLSAIYLVRGSRFVLFMGLLFALPTLFFMAPNICGPGYAENLNSWPVWFRLVFFSVKALPTVGLFAWLLAVATNPNRWCEGLRQEQQITSDHQSK